MMEITRRQVVQGVGAVGLGLVAGCALPFSAPPPVAKVHRIAYLSGAPPNAANGVLTAAFRQSLRDLGYVEGQNLLIDERHADGLDRIAEPAAGLVRLQPEVILVASIPIARAVLAASSTVPIVSAGAAGGGPDLVGSGLAASHAWPGGTVTGLSTPSLVGKQLQLLQEAVPSLVRVTILFDATSPDLRDFRREPYETVARRVGQQLQFVGAGGAADLEPAFDTAMREHADGLLVPTGGVTSANQTRIAELALQNRLPSMWQQSDAVARGGLLAYAPNRASMYRRAATYVDRILKGAKPADLPIEEPMLFDFVINLKTAQALGLTIPPSVLLQATEVIQ